MFFFSDHSSWETNLKSIPSKVVISWKQCSCDVLPERSIDFQIKVGVKNGKFYEGFKVKVIGWVEKIAQAMIQARVQAYSVNFWLLKVKNKTMIREALIKLYCFSFMWMKFPPLLTTVTFPCMQMIPSFCSAKTTIELEQKLNSDLQNLSRWFHWC
jgi:hypothetical protein